MISFTVIREIHAASPRLATQTFAAAATAAFAMSVLLLIASNQTMELARPNAIPGILWASLLVLLIFFAFSAIAAWRAQLLLETACQQSDLPQRTVQNAIQFTMRGVAAVVVAIILLFQGLALFLAMGVLFYAFIQGTKSAAAQTKQASYELAAAHADITTAINCAENAPLSLQAYAPEAQIWLSTELRQDFVSEGQISCRVDDASAHLATWSRLRWYAVLFCILFVLPAYGFTPPEAILMLGYALVLLDSLSLIWLAMVRDAAIREYQDDVLP